MRYRRMGTSGANKVNIYCIFPMIQMIPNTLEKLCPSQRYNTSGGTLSLLQLQSGDIPAPQYQGLGGLRGLNLI